MTLLEKELELLKKVQNEKNDYMEFMDDFKSELKEVKALLNSYFSKKKWMGLLSPNLLCLLLLTLQGN